MLEQLLEVCGVIFGLSSCGIPISTSPVEQANWSEVQVKLKNGRSVNCLIWIGTSKGGPSCDWANAR